MPIWHDSVCPHGRLAGSQTSCPPRFSCVRGPGSKLGQHRCLPSCSTEGFPTSPNFKSNLIWSLEVVDSQIIVNLPITNAPWFIGSNAKMLGLQHLQFLDMGASSRSPDGTRVVHRGTDDLLIQQNTIPDGEITSPSPCADFFSPDLYISTR